jgi:hypothetical protein
MKTFEPCDCRDIAVRIFESRAAAESSSVEQKLFSLYTSAIPFFFLKME